MNTFIRLVLLDCILFTASAAFAEGATHWSYSEEDGPENWAKLSPEFGACAGKHVQQRVQRFCQT